MGNFRVEGEYFYRSATHDGTDVPYDSATNYDPGTDPGFQIVMDGVDDVLSHNVFANLYYDFRSDSKFTPSLGDWSRLCEDLACVPDLLAPDE